VNGIELARRLWADAVEPILSRRFPDLDVAAALVGYGSEVLGFDDELSQDHHWGPRLFLFVRVVDLPRANAVLAALADELPLEVAGVPTNFGPPGPDGSRMPQRVEHGPVAHRVEVTTVSAFIRSELGVNALGVDSFGALSVADWLVTPTQQLLRVTAGEVFHDAVGELTSARAALAWYPHDVWLLAMAGEWRRVAQLEHLLGRAGGRGDELGSRLIGARLVEALMRLGFLQSRRYAPYPKWFGSAYEQLGRREREALEAALAAAQWQEREAELLRASRAVAASHNALGVTPALDPEPRAFHGRPFRVLDAGRFVDALRAAIRDSEVHRITHDALPVDAVATNVDLLTQPALWRTLRDLYL
jgi:uncharacterized protein DUF4037